MVTNHVFQDQIPSHDKSYKLADRNVDVGVGRSSPGDSRAEFSIAECLNEEIWSRRDIGLL